MVHRVKSLSKPRHLHSIIPSSNPHSFTASNHQIRRLPYKSGQTPYLFCIKRDVLTWSSIPPQKPFHQRGKHDNGTIPVLLFPLWQTWFCKAGRRIQLERQRANNGSTGNDHERQTTGSDHEFIARICWTVWIAVKRIYRLGIYLFVRFPVLSGFW